jgi:Ferredoxin subunits of nitrite reductase and ring-hydroxylating dioxygenases
MAWTHAASLDKARAARPWLPLAIAGVDLVIASVGDAWYAVEDRCTHAGCAFSEDADLAGSDIVCNCHGSEFDIRTGAVKRGPAERPVRTIPVRLAEDGLEVDL